MDEVEFGRYRLIDEIGSGGMGKVYRARDTILPRDVAIKVLPADRAEEPGYQDRFRREAHIAARLTEPNILAIYDAGEINGRLFLVMPVIDGIDLGCWLQRHQRMPPRLAVRVIEQLASALDAAHAVGLVHRDVKPSNALMTPHEHVYLIDFGIAHDGAATKLTATGSLLGSLPYMAAERLLTSKSDARSDVYSLACTFYECLTGERPCADELVIAGHLSAEPPRPSAMRADVFTGFDDVIARGMAKDPDQRFQPAGQLAVAARRALEPSTTGELAQPPTRIPETDVSECENTQRLPESPDLHNAETLAAPTVTSRQTEPRRTRRRIRIAIGSGLLSAAVVLAVAALLAPAGYYSCKGFGIYPYCGPNGELDTSTSVTYWIAPQQHQMLTALAAILLTAGVLVLLRSRWWTYILALVAGYGALLMLPDRDINHAAFLSSLLLPTAICVLIGWAITRRSRRSQAAAARGPRTAGQMPRLRPVTAADDARGLTSVAQDYLRVIFKAQEWSGEKVSTKMLAERIGVSASTASESIRKLADQGLVEHEKYGAVTLTERGRRAAVSVVRRHRLLETFLVQVLGYSWDEVDDEAEVLEHAVSDLMLSRIDAKLGHPQRDPHGDPIPTLDGQVPTPPACRLSECENGDHGSVARISDADPEMLRYFDAVGISLDSHLTVLARRDFAGTVSVAIGEGHNAGNHTIELGSPAAQSIWVLPC